jgi:O-antigen ligase
MNNTIKQRESLRNTIAYGHMVVFGVSLPFDRFYSQLLLISLLVHTLINLRRDRLRTCLRWPVLILQGVYLSTMLATIYSPHGAIAFGFWEKQVAILVFPLLVVLNPIDRPGFLRYLLMAFVAANTIVVLYLFADAIRIIHFYKLPMTALFSSAFLSHQFSAPIGLHATYLSLYCALSVFVLVDALVTGATKWERIAFPLCLAVMGAGLLQLGSKAVLISTFAVLLLIVPLRIRTARKRLVYLVLTLITVAGLSVLIRRTDALQARIVTGLQNDLAESRSPYSIADPRAKRWREAWALVREAPLLGHGSGEEIVLLRERYFQRGMYDSYLNKLNAHNQYISLLIKGGVPALCCFVLALVYSFRHALRQKTIYATGFVVLIAVVSVSENILDVNKGIFFYSFFGSLFLLGSAAPAPSRTRINGRRSNHRQPDAVLTTSDLLS